MTDDNRSPLDRLKEGERLQRALEVAGEEYPVAAEDFLEWASENFRWLRDVVLAADVLHTAWAHGGGNDRHYHGQLDRALYPEAYADEKPITQSEDAS